MTIMDVTELREARKALETDLACLIDQKIKEFKERTQFSPHGIRVQLQEVTAVGDSEPEFVVASVDVDIPL